MSDDAPKSALELAMERLRKKDALDGAAAPALSDAQKAAIAETRAFYEARLAQEDVLHQSKMRTMADPGEREEADRQYRRERERLTGEREAKLEKIRRNE